MKDLNIMYVEDEENDVTLLRYALRKAEMELPMRHLSDGASAMEYLSGRGKYRDRLKYPLPDLMLLDIKMPVMDGLSLLKWVRSQPDLACLVVIMLSSSDEESDVRQAYERGANSYVMKSPDLTAQVKMLRSFRDWWCDQNCSVPPKRVQREHLGWERKESAFPRLHPAFSRPHPFHAPPAIRRSTG
jgi:CheY-like chemotaxis protein